MGYWIIDVNGNLVTIEADVKIAYAIAEEIGGEVVEIYISTTKK